MKIILAAIPLVLCLGAAPEAGLQEKVELKWKFEKDLEIRYKTIQKTAMEFGGQPMNQEMSNTYSMTVTEVDDKGQATLTLKYLAVATKAVTPQGEHDYDSEKDKEAPAEGPAAFMAKLVGKSFTMKMTPAGKVTEVRGFDKVFDAILKDGGDEAQAEQMRQMFSNDSFKGIMQQMAPPLPEGKVGKGDSWTSEFTVKMPFLGAMKFGIQSTLADFQGGNAVIEQETKIEIKDGKDNPLAGVVDLKEAKGKSSLVFSTEKGVVLSHKGKMKMVMEVSGQQMPINTDNELKLIPK